jgi:pimeloyl-ACP methyl ester carboxylesterase
MGRGFEDIKQHKLSVGESCISVSESGPVDPEKTLVFLSGRYGVAALWQPVVERLRFRFRCLSIDLPGFGESFSSRDDGYSLGELALMVRLIVSHFCKKGPKAVLVGHDVGGAIATMLACSAPPEEEKLIEALTLINSSSLSESSQGLKVGFFGVAARFQFLKTAAKSPLLSQLDLESIWKPWRGYHSQARAALFRVFRSLEASWPGPFEQRFWRRELSRMNLPVLVLWGKNDHLNHRESGLELARIIPNVVYHEEEKCGHWALLENPDWVSVRIQEFLFGIKLGQKSLSR